MAPAALETLPGPATPLLATFAVMELVKSAPWSGFRPTLAQFRTGTRELVVLEDHRQGLRMGIVLAGFYFIGRRDWHRIVVCLLGFIIARIIVIRLTRTPIEQSNSTVKEAGHAP